MNQIGMIINEHRKKQGMTQQQLADHLFVSPQAVSKWEKGQSEPDLATLRKIAELFGITVDQFLSVTPDPSEDTTEQHHHCSVCGQSFGSSAIAQDEPKIICKRCVSVMAQEQLAVDTLVVRSKTINRKRHGISRAPLIIGSIVGVGFFILVLLGYLSETSTRESFGSFLTNNLIASVWIALFVIQICYDSILKDIMGAFFGHSLALPGLIVEFSVDGLITYIIIKLIFGVLAFLIGILLFLLGISLGFLIAPFTMAYEIIQWKRERS